MRKKMFRDIVEEDFLGHEQYKSPDEMYKEYCGYYGDFVGPDTVVKMVQFEVDA